MQTQTITLEFPASQLYALQLALVEREHDLYRQIAKGQLQGRSTATEQLHVQALSALRYQLTTHI
jgi:hypothetical protein